MSTFAPHLRSFHEKQTFITPSRRNYASAQTYDWLRLETFQNGRKREFYVDLSHPVKNLTAAFSDSAKDGLQNIGSFFSKLFNRLTNEPDYRR